MPLPLIPLIAGAIVTGATAHGIKKGVEGKRDFEEAKLINSTSQSYAKEAEDFIKMAQGKTREAISDFAKEKIHILTTSMNEFILYFEKIKKMDSSSLNNANIVGNFNSPQTSFVHLKNASLEAKQLAINGLSSIGSGVLLSYGTYSVVMSGVGGLLVTATTGTTLSSLSGAAAANATLAWLGGGALSVGGFGIAGGTLVLGGLAAGPALAIGGSMFASQAKTELNDAYNNYDKARTFRSQAKNIGIVLKGICIRANQLEELLHNLDTFFIPKVEVLKNIINSSGTDWSKYTIEQKNNIYQCYQLANTIKEILCTSLLEEDGTLNEKSEYVLNNGYKYLKSLSSL